MKVTAYRAALHYVQRCPVAIPLLLYGLKNPL